MAEHIKFSKHKIDEQNIKLLDSEANWRKRGIKEAIHIRKNNPSLNRDKGRHNLSHAWDKILELPVTHTHHLTRENGVF